VFVFLTKQHAMKMYWRSKSLAQCILNLGTRWKCVVSITHWTLYPQGKSLWYPLDRRRGETQSRSGCGGERKQSNYYLCRESTAII